MGLYTGCRCLLAGLSLTPPTNTTAWPVDAGRCAVVWNISWADMDGRDTDSFPDLVGADEAIVRIRATRPYVTFRGETPVTFLLRDVVCRIRDGHLAAPDGKPYIIIVPSSGGGVQETGWHYVATVEQGGSILHTVVFDAAAGSTVDLTLLTDAVLPRLVRENDVTGLWDSVKRLYSTEDGARQVREMPEQVELIIVNKHWGDSEKYKQEYVRDMVQRAAEDYSEGKGGCDYWRIILEKDENLIFLLQHYIDNNTTHMAYYDHVPKILREHPEKVAYVLQYAGYEEFVKQDGWYLAPDLWKTHADMMLHDNYGMEHSLKSYSRVEIPAEGTYAPDLLWDKPYMVARALFDPTIQDLIKQNIANDGNVVYERSFMNLATIGVDVSRVFNSMAKFKYTSFDNTGDQQEVLDRFCAGLSTDTIGAVVFAPRDPSDPNWQPEVTCNIDIVDGSTVTRYTKSLGDLCSKARWLLVLPGMSFKLGDPATVSLGEMKYVQAPDNLTVDL